MSIPSFHSFRWKKMSQSEKCVYEAKEAKKLWNAVKKTSNQVQERAQRGSNCYADTQASNKCERPGQATHKDVLQNKNCSNVNIVNMQPQKSNLNQEQLKKPDAMYKYKNRKHQEEVILYDRQCQETKQSVCEDRRCPSTQCSNRQPVKPVMKNVWSRVLHM